MQFPACFYLTLESLMKFCKLWISLWSAILSRSDYSKIMGLGPWRVKQDWPFPWMKVVSMIKVLEFQITPVYRLTFEKSWEACFTGFHVLVLQAVEHHGKLERLQINMLKNPKSSGGLNLPCVFSKANDLFLSQTCRLLLSSESKHFGSTGLVSI